MYDEKAIKNSERLRIIKGDITRLEVDAIVNAANNSLLGGGGVDGAIHKAAGPGLYKECLSLNGCKTGQAKITSGYKLPAKFVIHTVGPIWQGGNSNEAELLAACYVNSINLAIENGVKTMAFPSISTGAYGYPVDQAARIAYQTVMNMLAIHPVDELETVYLVCFDDKTYLEYQNIINSLRN